VLGGPKVAPSAPSQWRQAPQVSGHCLSGARQCTRSLNSLFEL